jgi:predicted RNase H-like nuclease (RuvC/YqgF family)
MSIDQQHEIERLFEANERLTRQLAEAQDEIMQLKAQNERQGLQLRQDAAK